MDKNNIYQTIKELLISDYQINPELISIEKRLDEDLGLDSLDIIEIINGLENHIGENIDPNLFKDARTVRDIVDLFQPIWK
jgi:acyl carrier protein